MPVKVETIDHRRLVQKRLSIVMAFLALALASIVASRAHAQESPYFTAAMPEKYADATKLKRQESQISLALSDASLTAQSENWQAAQDYYTRYMLFLMSQPDPGVKLTEFTYDALRNIERANQTAAPAFRSALTGWIKSGAERVAAGQVQNKSFSPVARINATLILANLNRQPARNGNPPVPDVPGTSNVLVGLYESADAPSGVRVMALSGIRRHSTLMAGAMPDEYKSKYLPIGKGLLDGNLPAGLDQESLDPAALAFMQRYAVDIVRALGSPDDHKQLAQKLTQIVAEKGAPSLIALYAARNLPKLQQEGLKELTVAPPTVVAWGDRAATALANEVERLKSLDRPAPATPQQGPKPAGGGAMGGAYGMEGGYPGAEGGYPGGEGGYPGGEGGYPGTEGGYPGMEGGMEGYGMEGYGMGMGAAPAAKPQPPEVVAARRRINANLEALLLGLAGSLDPDKPGAGLAAVATDQGKAQVDDLLATLRTTAEEVNNPAHDDRKKFLEMLETNSTALNRWVRTRKPAGPAAAATDTAATDTTATGPGVAVN